MDDSHDPHCAFCQKNNKQVKKLIAGPNVYICESCIEKCHALLIKSDMPQDEREAETETATEEARVNPRDIKEFLDRYVIGQDDAKMVVSVAAYNHYKRITNPVIGDIEIDKSNILLLGPTGSGKTLLAQSLARVLEVPCVIRDATALTEAGYVGEDVETMVAALLAAAKGDVKLAERGIIFIDEIDKKRSKGSGAQSRDVSGDGVQQALLRMLEGTEVTVNKRGNGEGVKVNTKNILFIVSGAFVGIDQIVTDKKTSIGFGNPKTVAATDKPLDVKAEHLIKFGMIPELVGRLPVIAALEPLTEEHLMRVLTEPRNAVTKQFQALFGLDNVELEFTEDALRKVAKTAITDKTGARGLRAVIEKELTKVQFELPTMAEAGLLKVTITADLVDYTFDESKIEPSVNIAKKK